MLSLTERIRQLELAALASRSVEHTSLLQRVAQLEKTLASSKMLAGVMETNFRKACADRDAAVRRLTLYEEADTFTRQAQASQAQPSAGANVAAPNVSSNSQARPLPLPLPPKAKPKGSAIPSVRETTVRRLTSRWRLASPGQ